MPHLRSRTLPGPPGDRSPRGRRCMPRSRGSMSLEQSSRKISWVRHQSLRFVRANGPLGLCCRWGDGGLCVPKVAGSEPRSGRAVIENNFQQQVPLPVLRCQPQSSFGARARRLGATPAPHPRESGEWRSPYALFSTTLVVAEPISRRRRRRRGDGHHHRHHHRRYLRHRYCPRCRSSCRPCRAMFEGKPRWP